MQVRFAKVLLSLLLTTVWPLPLMQFAPPVAAQVNPDIPRKRVAVLDFDFSSLSSPYLSSFGGVGAGKAVSDILINKLVKDGTYIVIERGKIEQILREQNLALGGRVQPGTEAQLGKLLGVDALIVGTITKFNLEERTSGGSLGFFGINVGSKDTRAFVALSARIVSATSGEILAVADAEADTSQSDSSVYVLGTGGGSSTNNQDTLLATATGQALDKMSPQIISASPRLQSFVDTAVSAKIADITGNLITINKGKEVGLKPGMTLTVERIVKEVKDPETGKVLRQITSPIGELVLTETGAGSSLAMITQGRAKDFKVGFIAKLKTSLSVTGTVTPKP